MGTTPMEMGGSNQMIFSIGALIIGQNGIPSQGSLAILLLVVALFTLVNLMGAQWAARLRNL